MGRLAPCDAANLKLSVGGPPCCGAPIWEHTGLDVMGPVVRFVLFVWGLAKVILKKLKVRTHGVVLILLRDTSLGV